MIMFIRKLLMIILGGILVIYLLLVLVAVFFSDTLILPGRRSNTKIPQLLRIDVAQGEYLTARYLTSPNATYTILYCHGNAEDLGDLADLLDKYQRHGYNLLAFDYRGYGSSLGKCSPANALVDTQAAWTYLTNTLHVPPERVILLGRSVGGAMAAQLATQHSAAGVILESTFTSAFRAVIPIPLVPFDKLETIDLIETIDEPILVIHGMDDRLINCRHGRCLYDRAKEPKQCLWVDGAGHNDVPLIAGEAYWKALDDFSRQITRMQKDKNFRQ
ncbi:MAG: alpha/beta hydrolase [Sedimentisphaerales bacterium]|nr:alpha/beta hydrolase [Sedimentisphaerales bacterium]